MGIFNFGKKKEIVKEESSCCFCGKAVDTGTEGSSVVDENADIESIKVLGSGCKSCHELYENTLKAVKNRGLSIEVNYITDLEKIMVYGSMSMPVLVVNEKVVSAGKILKAADIEEVLHRFGY